MADPTVQRNTDMTLLARRRPAAALMLASLVVLGLVQLCSGIREGASIVTEKVKTLQQQEAERLAEWKPMDLKAFGPLAKLRGVERHGLDNAEVFSQLDEDGSGYLSKNEVAGLKQIVDKRIEEKRRNAELHPEEMTTYAEFEALFEPGGEYEADTWLAREYKADGGLPHIFNRLDVDKDHQLSPAELYNLPYFLGRGEKGIKLNEDALFLKIYEQEVPGAAKPEL